MLILQQFISLSSEQFWHGDKALEGAFSNEQIHFKNRGCRASVDLNLLHEIECFG